MRFLRYAMQIFNQLAICAGAVLASKNKKLVLDPICLFRDISFYTISLIFLYNALLDRRVGDDNVERVYIQKFDAYLLVGWYIVYVLVCANYDRILYLLRIDQEPEELEEQSHYEAFETTGPGGVLQVCDWRGSKYHPLLKACFPHKISQ